MIMHAGMIIPYDRILKNYLTRGLANILDYMHVKCMIIGTAMQHMNKPGTAVYIHVRRVSSMHDALAFPKRPIGVTSSEIEGCVVSALNVVVQLVNDVRSTGVSVCPVKGNICIQTCRNP